MSVSSHVTKLTNQYTDLNSNRDYDLQQAISGFNPSRDPAINEKVIKIANVSNSINLICEKMYDLLKMKLGKESMPSQISPEKDKAIEKEFGKSLEMFELDCDSLSNDIEMEKKEFLNNFLKYGADGLITDKLINDYKEKREQNYKHVIGELKDISAKIDKGFLN